MSTSESVMAAHNSFTQQNGDMSTRTVRATMESIKSVHENPFYKSFGIKHNAPAYPPRQVNRPVAGEQMKEGSNGRLSLASDDIGEYRPGSGYVHKLLDKFSSLTTREDHATPLPHLKRSSSLDELPVDNETVKDPTVGSRGSGLRYEKPSFLSAAKLSHRARSIESLNHGFHKSHHAVATSFHQADARLGVDKQQFTHKFQKESPLVSLDADTTRDEVATNETTRAALLENFEENDERIQAVSSHEAVLQDELPKPNTVLTVRNIFENASSGNVLSTRRQRSDSPSFVSMQTVKPVIAPLQAAHISSSSQDAVLNRTGSLVSSPLASPKHAGDTHTKNILLPTNSSLSKADNARHASDSDVPSRSNVQKLITTKSNNSGMIISRPSTSSAVSSSLHRSGASPTSPSALSPVTNTDGRLFRFERESSLETSPAPDILHHASSQSESNVQPTNTSVELNASALSNNQKSSTSFIDKNEDGKYYEHPVMIFTKSNLSPTKTKPQRVRDYTPVNDVADVGSEDIQPGKDVSQFKETKVNIEKNDFIPQSPETKNTVLSQRKLFESGSKSIDKQTSDKSRSVSLRHQTAIEAKSSLKSTLSSGKSNVEYKSKSVSAAVVFHNVPLKKSSVKKTKVQGAPPSLEKQHVPHTNYSKDYKKHVTFAENLEVGESRNKPGGSSLDNTSTSGESISDAHEEISETNKTMFSNESPALNEQPLSKVNQDKIEVKEQPVKGIPSIVAQRLKTNFDPSQVAVDVVSSSADNELSSEAAKKDHNSESDITLPLDTNGKDSVSTEIDNMFAAVRKKMEESRSKSAGLAPIFDSSQLTKKRKEKRASQQQASASQDGVPSLNLSGITDDRSVEYQPQPKKIASCGIVFIGENAMTSRSLLVKQRKTKISIHFNDAKTETFEYPSEASALERYLEDHPHESGDILVLEDFTDRGDNNDESTDDVEIDVFETPVTPRGNSDDDLLKSNTSLAHTGSLQSYRGRFQEDYELGTLRLEEEEETVKATAPEAEVDPDKLMLRPAEEEDTNTWSTSSSSDILF